MPRTEDTANKETKGYCWYKATNGIKRHLLVDVLGNPYFVRCTKASVSDDDALLAMIGEHKQYFLDIPPEQTVTILLDNGYHKEYLEQGIERIEEQLREKIRIEISAKITPEQKAESKKACRRKTDLWWSKSGGLSSEQMRGSISVECCGRIAKGCCEPAKRKSGFARFD